MATHQGDDRGSLFSYSSSSQGSQGGGYNNSSPSALQQKGGTNKLNMPEIIQFLQKEFKKYESDKELWELERAEFQMKIASYESMRSTHEKIQYDLLRRIKMLEYALRHERYRFKQAIDTIKATPNISSGILQILESLLPLPAVNTSDELQSELTELNKEILSAPQVPDSILKASVGQHPHSSEILIKYLEEINCTEVGPLISKTSDIPAESVQGSKKTSQEPEKSLSSPETSIKTKEINNNTKEDGTNHNDTNDIKYKINTQSAKETFIIREDTIVNDSVKDDIRGKDKISNDDFNHITKNSIHSEKDKNAYNVTKTDPTVDSSKRIIDSSNDIQNSNDNNSLYSPTPRPNLTKKEYKTQSVASTIDDDDDDDDNEKKPATQLFVPPSDGSFKKRVSWNFDNKSVDSRKSKSIDMFNSFQNVTTANQEQKKKTKPSSRDKSKSIDVNIETSLPSWSPKCTLSQHLDGVKSICFHPSLKALVSGSEDCTLKYWNLNSTHKQPVINSPVHTFRGHTGPIFSVSCVEKFCFSAGEDTDIRVWELPDLNHDPYTNYGVASPLSKVVLKGHHNAVWSLCADLKSSNLLSASSDGSVKIWDYLQTNNYLKASFSTSVNNVDYTPTSITYLKSDQSKFVVSYTNGYLSLFDIEKGVAIWNVASVSSGSDPTDHISHLIYQVCSHATLPLIFTGSEDKNIRFFDFNTGKIIQEMVGHRDAVSTLCVDTSGLYLISGGHDCSVRFWDISSKKCVKDITAHRTKYDESVNSVDSHATCHFVASGGADSLVKIFE